MYMNSKIEDEYKYLHFIMIILHYTYLPSRLSQKMVAFLKKKKIVGFYVGF